MTRDVLWVLPGPPEISSLIILRTTIDQLNLIIIAKGQTLVSGDMLLSTRPGLKLFGNDAPTLRLHIEV